MKREHGFFPPDFLSAGCCSLTDDDRFNGALARGMSVLRVFHGHTLLGNLEIAELTGVSKPTVSRLTYTLTQLGYFRYRPERLNSVSMNSQPA